MIVITTLVLALIAILYGIGKLACHFVDTPLDWEKQSKNSHREILHQVVPHRKTAIEAYSSFSLDLTRLISRYEQHQFTYNLLNELQPLQRKLNKFLTPSKTKLDWRGRRES
jgi:hypothetical protein